MALSADTIRKQRNLEGKKQSDYVVKNGVTVYQGSLVSIDTTNGRVTTSQVDGAECAGMATEQVTGDSSASVLVEWGQSVKVTATNITAAYLGKNASIVDDDKVGTVTTVTSAGNSTRVGRIESISGSSVWVSLLNFAHNDS